MGKVLNKHLKREDMQMPSKPIKVFNHWHMQNETTMRYRSVPSRMAKITKTTSKVGKHDEQQQLLHIASGGAASTAALESSLVVSYKAKYMSVL